MSGIQACQAPLELLLGPIIPVNHPDLLRPARHALHERQQISLIPMSRITANRLHCRLDAVLASLKLDPGTLPPGLNRLARGALRLVTHKQHIMPGILKHGFQVVDDSPARTHTTGSNHYRRPGTICQMAHHTQMGVVTVHRQQLPKGQRSAARH